MKYRMKGEYKIDGADSLVRRIAEHNDYYVLIIQYYCSCLWDILIIYQVLAMVFYKYGVKSVLEEMDDLNTPLLESKLVHLVSPDNPVVPNFVFWSLFCSFFAYLWSKNIDLPAAMNYTLPLFLFSLKLHMVPPAMVYISLYGEWYWCFAIYAVCLTLMVVFRSFLSLDPPIGGRYFFNDCRTKHLFRDFYYNEYKPAYLRNLKARQSGAISVNGNEMKRKL